MAERVRLGREAAGELLDRLVADADELARADCSARPRSG
jgi:hypothetical protein